MVPKLEPQEKNLLRKALSFAQKKNVKLYLVGGYLRDIILKRKKENPDIDFCLKKGAINFGRGLARELEAGFVVLDKEHGCARLVKRIGKRAYTLDFTDFRGRTLEDDLRARDFTINALAIELKDFLRPGDLNRYLVDPAGARKALEKKVICAIGKNGFDADPLRILRAFSLSAIFGFKICPRTCRLIRSKRDKLSGVSFERIRDELFKILDSTDAYTYIALLDKFKILKIIIPEIEICRGVNQGPYHHLDVLKHNLESLRQLEGIFGEFKQHQDIQDYLHQTISGERKRYSLLKLGALLHDIGKPQAKRRKGKKTIFHGHERIGANLARTAAVRLKLSSDEQNRLQKMVFWHLRPGYLADSEQPSARAKFRYFRDTADEAVSVLLLSLADQRSTRGPLTTRESRLQHERVVPALIREYFRKLKEKKFPRLVTGNDLIKKLKLKASPLIGKILEAIEEAQAVGKIKTKAQALQLAKKITLSKGQNKMKPNRQRQVSF